MSLHQAEVLQLQKQVLNIIMYLIVKLTFPFSISVSTYSPLLRLPLKSNAQHDSYFEIDCLADFDVVFCCSGINTDPNDWDSEQKFTEQQ